MCIFGDARSSAWSTSGSGWLPSRSRTSPIRRRSIYYDALLPDVARPIARGRLSGIGVALGYCGTLLVGVLLLAGISTDVDGGSTPAIAFALVAGALPRSSPGRSSCSSASATRRLAVPFRATDALRSFGQLARTVCARARVAGPAALHRRALLLLRPGEHRHRGHERVRGPCGGLHRGPGAAGPADPHRGGGHRVDRLGRPGRSLGPAPDPVRGPRDLGGRPGDPHRLPGHRFHSCSPARCSAPGLAGSASSIG